MLVLPELPLIYQVVSSCDLIVSVGFNALDGVVCVKGVVVNHYLINSVINWHLVINWEQTWFLHLFNLLEPGMSSDLFDGVTLIWVGVQDLLDQVCAICTQELRDLVICIQDLLVEV